MNPENEEAEVTPQALDVASGVSRRNLLGGAAAIGGVLALTQGCSKSTSTPTGKKVVVVGGGLTGCIAARELAHRGYQVTLLEAQGRLGGRTFTGEFAGKKAELGALMLSWGQPFLWAEVTRYNLEIEPIVGALTPEICYWIADGQTFSGPSAKFFDVFGSAVKEFFKDALTAFPYPYEPLKNIDTVRELDKLSCADRLATFSDPITRDLADNWASAPLGRAGRNAGLAASMALTSAFGGVDASLAGASYRLKEGASILTKKISEDGGFEVKLGSVVSKIEQSDASVKVSIASGETLLADAVLVAVPANTYANIEFLPKIAQGKIDVAKGRMAGGKGVHINARIKGKMPAIMAVAPSDTLLHLLLTTDILEDSCILDGYGPDAELLDGNDKDAVQAAIRKWIPDAEVIETMAYRWDLDPYAQGTWCGYGPGVLTKYFEDLRKAEGRVFFASADSASAFRGFMEGAAESGVRVSRDIHALLSN
ncbi:MAG: hypothetical protein RL268_11 [Pseudomonadota bacterium]|jgi:monoamine oxidase